MGTEIESATLTVPEACVILGISRNYGFQLARKGKFPGARRLGLGEGGRTGVRSGRWLVSRKVLQEFLDGTESIDRDGVPHLR
jgi:predicted DNA-binding transcriptional regulator AlpA